MTEPSDIANLFNNYFHFVFTSSDCIVPPFDSIPTPRNQFSLISVNCSDVFEVLSSLDLAKAMGNDEINPCILRFCASILAEPFTHLFALYI